MILNRRTYLNFPIAEVVKAPAPPQSGTTFDLVAGQGARFQPTPFMASVWPMNAQPDPTTAEVIRVTALVGDTVTCLRAQEETTARSIKKGDQLAGNLTAGELNSFGRWYPVDVTDPAIYATADPWYSPPVVGNWTPATDLVNSIYYWSRIGSGTLQVAVSLFGTTIGTPMSAEAALCLQLPTDPLEGLVTMPQAAGVLTAAAWVNAELAPVLMVHGDRYLRIRVSNAVSGVTRVSGSLTLPCEWWL